MKGYGKKQQIVLAALAHGPLGRATLESKTGMSGNPMDQQIFTMLKGGLIEREGTRGRYIYSRGKNAPPVVWTQPLKEPTPQAPEAAILPAAEMLKAVTTPPPVPSIDLTSLDKAIAEVAQGLVDQIAQKIVAAITGALPEAVTRAAEKFDVSQFTPKKTGPQHKKVFIAGLRTKDTGFITAEFATKFDLTFAETDEYSEKTKSNARNADVAIIMTDHINHSMVEFIKTAGAQPILLAGGQTTLRSKLDSIPA